MGPKEVSRRVMPDSSNLDSLITTLEVSVVAMAECRIDTGWRLFFPAAQLPAIHYNLKGEGRLTVEAGPPIPLLPHTMIVMPVGRSFYIDAVGHGELPSSLMVNEAHMLSLTSPDTLQVFTAGGGEPQIVTVCGYFRASYGTSIDVFTTLRSPIVEQFGAHDHMAHDLQSALAELAVPQIGMKAMTAALLKRVFVTLLRRSLSSAETWFERFSALSDPQIARAFADMVAMPGAAHSLATLAQSAGLSRSAFMARFLRAVGQPPMVVLRQARMRYAANLLSVNDLSIAQIAQVVGYTSRSSFSRAFRQAYGTDPSDFRAAAESAATS
jgi:AraC-like DNA-binding protein